MFSKRLIPIPVWEAAKAEVMAEQFYRSVVCNRGVMTSMVSDRDSRFTNDFWRKLWALHHTTLKMTPAYSPQADGQTERMMNRLLQEIMRSNVQAGGSTELVGTVRRCHDGDQQFAGVSDAEVAV